MTSSSINSNFKNLNRRFGLCIFAVSAFLFYTLLQSVVPIRPLSAFAFASDLRSTFEVVSTVLKKTRRNRQAAQMDLSSPTGSAESDYQQPADTGGRKGKEQSGADVVKSLKWVIFPENKWLKIWDMVVLFALFLISFILPYQIGVSGGVNLLVNIPWLVFNIFLNTIFFVDTFLYFFRAYRNKNGHMVVNLSTIQKHYLRTYFVPNFVSVLPFTIVFYIVGTEIINDPGGATSSQQQFFAFIKIAEILKLVRLARVNQILSSSQFVMNFRMKRNSQRLELAKFVFMIVVAAHWFACTWAFVAYIEARSLGNGLLERPNWIGFWYENNQVEGGLDPVGLDNHTDRYVLSLFWAIQTITSIGYGNIVPVTVAEWYISCLIQLCAGVMWAYVIGGLVGVTAAMQARSAAFRSRTDQANMLIREFVDPDDDSNDADKDLEDSRRVAKQIRMYIHQQYQRSRATRCANLITETFPVFETLSPDLQQKSSSLLVDQYLRAVPYLSSKYMSSEAQRLIALQCVLMELSAGDTILMEKGPGDLGRGIVILRHGVALVEKNKKEANQKFDLMSVGMACGSGKVLVEDNHPATKGMMQFLTYSKIFFVPRTAVLDALSLNPRAWKGCARWFYMRTLLIYCQPEEIDEEAKTPSDKDQS